VSSPDVFARIAVLEIFERSDVDLVAPGGGDIERSEGETTEVDRVSLVRETSVSKEVRLLGDFNVIASAMPCFLELSGGDVDGRDSSAGVGGWTASTERDDISLPVASVSCKTDGGDTLDSIVEVGTALGVRNWALETACLSIVGTLRAVPVARGDELNERELTGLGNEVAEVDKGVLGLSIVWSTDVSLLMLFCGSERGDGL